MKKFKILFLLLLVVLVTGCSKEKTAISSSDFVSIITEQGFSPYDDKDNFDYVEHAYVAKKNDITVVFIEGKKKVDIEGTYLDQCENVYKKVLEDNESHSTSGSNWSTLKIYDSSNYYYVSLIDNTYVYIEGSIDRKSKIERIIDALGY
jgi:hypothetical protein